MMMTHEETMGFIAALREKYLGEQEETKEEKVERARAILETHKHGSHNQATHGFRFGKTPSLTQARRYQKAGVLDEYSKRSRERSGTKPAKERNAAKPKWKGDLSKEDTAIIKNSPSRTSRNFQFGGGKFSISLKPEDDNGDREISVWVKSGRYNGANFSAGKINTRTGVVTPDSDLGLFRVPENQGIRAITSGLDAIVERDRVR